MKMSKKILVSVVIPTYNRQHYLKNCLERLANQTISQNSFEVIVVDDGSTCDISRVTNQFSNRIKNLSLIRIEDNTGKPGFVRNTGVKRAKGDVVAFIDDDCIAAIDWIEKIVFYHKRFRNINVIQGLLDNANKKNVYGVLWKFILDLNINQKTRHSKLKYDYIDLLGTDNLSVKKRIFNKFAFSNDLNAREDELFRLQLKKSSIDILYIPGIAVKHDCRKTLFSFLKQNFIYGSADFSMKKSFSNDKTTSPSLMNFAIFKLLFQKHGFSKCIKMFVLIILKNVAYLTGFLHQKLFVRA